MITDRKLLIILCITVVVLMISKYITSEGYALKTNEIKFGWRNKTTDGVTKWVIKLTGGNSDGNLVVLETKEIKKEDEPEYFKPFKNNEIIFDGRDFDFDTVKQGLKVDVYYNEESEPLITKALYLQKNMFSITLDLLTKLSETVFSFNQSDHEFENGFYTIKSKTGTKKFIINDRDEFEFSDKTYDDKECYDIFYLQKLQSWSNEFYLRSANNNKWTKTIRTSGGSIPYEFDSKEIKYSKGTKHYYTNRKFYRDVFNSNDSTGSNKKDKFEAINTEDGSWRDNARVYKMDQNYLYRMESGTPIKISDDEIVLTKVTNTCTVTQKGKGESTEFQKTVGWSNSIETSKWNEFTIPVEMRNYTQNKTCTSFSIAEVKTYANSVGTRVESDDTVETLCKRIFYTTPRFEEKKNGDAGEELPDWGTGCRHKGKYDRKGKTEGCEGKFSTADLYSSPPFRDLIKEYRMKESCSNLNDDYTPNDNCSWDIDYDDDSNPKFKYIKEYGTDVCPRDDKIKALKDAIDAQCEKITEKGLCLAEKTNDDTSSKITTIQNDFDTKKASAKISSHKPTNDLFNYDTLSTDQKWIRDHLPDFSKNFDESICNWRGSATEPVAEIDPRAGTIGDEICEAKTREELEAGIQGDQANRYKDSAWQSMRDTFTDGYEKIKEKCSETSVGNCQRPNYGPNTSQFGTDFANLYKNGNSSIHQFACKKSTYGWDLDGTRYDVKQRKDEEDRIKREQEAVEAAEKLAREIAEESKSFVDKTIKPIPGKNQMVSTFFIDRDSDDISPFYARVSNIDLGTMRSSGKYLDANDKYIIVNDEAYEMDQESAVYVYDRNGNTLVQKIVPPSDKKIETFPGSSSISDKNDLFIEALKTNDVDGGDIQHCRYAKSSDKIKVILYYKLKDGKFVYNSMIQFKDTDNEYACVEVHDSLSNTLISGHYTENRNTIKYLIDSVYYTVKSGNEKTIYDNLTGYANNIAKRKLQDSTIIIMTDKVDGKWKFHSEITKKHHETIIHDKIRFGSYIVGNKSTTKDDIRIATIEIDSNKTSQFGYIYIYNIDGVEKAKLNVPFKKNDPTAISMSMYDKTLVVSSPPRASTSKLGEVYVYKNTGNDNWVLKQTLPNSGDGFVLSDYYGFSVDVNNSYLAVGVPGSDVTVSFKENESQKLNRQGKVILYKLNGDKYEYNKTLLRKTHYLPNNSTVKDLSFGNNVLIKKQINKTEPIVLSGSGPALLSNQTSSGAWNEEYEGGAGYIYGFDLSG